MLRCKACRRPLSNAISKKYGYGPDCLKRAVEQGNAPLESLAELKEFRSAKPKQPRRIAESETVRCDKTLDIFEQARSEAIRMLKCSVSECEAFGLKVNYSIEEKT